MIDSQLKNLIRLKYFETPYTVFSISNWHFSFTPSLLRMFYVLITVIFLFRFSQPLLICVCFYNFRKENIYL